MFFSGPQALLWTNVLNVVRKDLEGFVESGGWSGILGDEDSDDEDEEDDDDDDEERRERRESRRRAREEEEAGEGSDYDPDEDEDDGEDDDDDVNKKFFTCLNVKNFFFSRLFLV